MLSFAGFGIAAAPLGLLAEAIGLRQAIVLMGAVAIVGVAVYGWLEHRERYTHHLPEPEDTAAPVAGT